MKLCCYNVTGQSQESEGSNKQARIKEVHAKLHSFHASLCTLTATHLILIYVCTYIRMSVPLGCLNKQEGIIIQYPYNPKFVGNTRNRTRDLWLDKGSFTYYVISRGGGGGLAVDYQFEFFYLIHFPNEFLEPVF